MKCHHDQANATNEEVNINTDGDNEDLKVVDGLGYATIVNVEAGDASGDESLTTVCTRGLNA